MLSPSGIFSFLSTFTEKHRAFLAPAGTDSRERNVCQAQSQSQRNLQTTVRSLQNDLSARHVPSASDKKMLVWAKMYKTIEEIPKEVSLTQMRKARDKARIRVNLGMAAATVLGCIIVIGYAKSRQGSGDSLQSRGLEYERQMKELGRKERELKIESQKVN